MKLFSGVEPLKVKPEDIDSSVGTYGIPEFGTRFVRQMLEATAPPVFRNWSESADCLTVPMFGTIMPRI
jgi:DNA polymerase III alpha subunit (gram-positive type)